MECIKGKIPEKLYKILESEGIKKLRPAQSKAVKAGLLNGKNLLVCTPTASGKTLIAELAILNTFIKSNSKAVYIVPLKALASEKYKEFSRKYSSFAKIALSVGDLDSADSNLRYADIIITVSEKFDSLLRHNIPWLDEVKVVVIDEIHLLNDLSRGPTLEVIITLLKSTLSDVQLIGLSATIGNAEALAEWLDAKLIIDEWRPVKLYKGVYYDGEIEFKEED